MRCNADGGENDFNSYIHGDRVKYTHVRSVIDRKPGCTALLAWADLQVGQLHTA